MVVSFCQELMMTGRRKKTLWVLGGAFIVLMVPLGMMVREARHAALKTSDR